MIPGPSDRESFFAAQERHRRSTWRIGLLCLLSVILLGIPLSAMITPLIIGGVVICSDLINIFTAVPDLFHPIIGTIDTIVSYNSLTQLITMKGMLLLLCCFSSGSIAILFIWLAIRRLIVNAGSEAILQLMETRDPDLTDLEEKQLVNVVEEMSIAAGVKPPTVKLYSSDTANGAVLGKSEEEAVIIISRRLLDDYDREETQGIIAHLVGSLSNGDLRISMVVLSLFMVIGVLLILLGSASSGRNRSLARRLFRSLLIGGKERVGDKELVLDLLQNSDEIEVDEVLEPKTKPGRWLQQVRQVLRLPFLILYGMFQIVKTILLIFIVGPMLSWLWRTRCYLADSTAVQLTRNPDSLARGLEKMAGEEASIPGSGYMEHLFIVGTGTVGPKTGKRSGLDSRKSRKKSHGMIISMFPPVSKRLQKLRRLGSSVTLESTAPPGPPAGGRNLTISIILLILLIPLAGFALMCIYAALVIATALGVGAGMLLLMAVLGILHPLLRMI